MNRKMDYQVVTSGDLSMERAASALADRIGRLIDQGWEPTGGVALVSVQSINDKPYYEVMQAVIQRIE